LNKLILTLILLYQSLASAGEVISNVRGKILINTYGEKYNLNQKLYIYNPVTQRKIGIVKVMQKRRDQEAVLAELVNGKALPGALAEVAERNVATDDEVDIRGHRTRAREFDRRAKRDSSGTLKTKHGLSINLINTQLSVKAPNISTKMTGTGLGFDYTFQVPTYIRTSFLGDLGIHPIKLSNSATNGDNNHFDVTYFSIVGMLKYIFNPNQTGSWIAGGIGFILPYTKSSNVLESDSIATNYSINFAVGTDIPAKNQLISLKFAYAIFPSSNTGNSQISFSQMTFGFVYFY
jgi:hypothetical protein